MRVGVFGGSFDPVHIGHLIVAQAAADELALDRVRFVPAFRQPLKVAGHAAGPADRVAMLELALAGNPAFVLDRREIDRGGPSYMVETLASLRTESPEDQLFLLVGADAVEGLRAWHDAERIPALCTVVGLSRVGVRPARGGLVARSVDVPAIGVSATAIRAAVRSGKSIRYLVPPGVARYIAENSLYRQETA